MKIKKEDALTIISSDLNGLQITSEISDSSNVSITLKENDNLEQYFLDEKEIDLFIEHLKKAKEILIENMQQS